VLTDEVVAAVSLAGGGGERASTVAIDEVEAALSIRGSAAAAWSGTGGCCTDTTTAPMSTALGESIASSQERGRRVTIERSQATSHESEKPHAIADGDCGDRGSASTARGDELITAAEAISLRCELASTGTTCACRFVSL